MSLGEGPRIEPLETNVAFRCQEEGCSQPPFANHTALAAHIWQKHGHVSTAKETLKKRLYLLRKADPENAPPRQRPGPRPGTLYKRLCVACGNVLVRGATRAIPGFREAPLSVEQVEFARQRLIWQTKKLAAEMQTTEDKVLAVITVLVLRRLLPDEAATSGRSNGAG